MATSIRSDSRFTIHSNLCILKIAIQTNDHIEILCANYYIIFRCRLPWNQTTLIGCIASRLYALLFGQSYVILNGVFGSYFVSIVHHHNAFNKHYHALCEQLNEISHKRNNAFEAKQMLIKIIKFHTAAKRYIRYI